MLLPIVQIIIILLHINGGFMQIIEYYVIFWLFAILGWLMEVIVCSISEKKFVNRGFLLGPYCPIYGFGGIILLSLRRYSNDLLVVFLLSMIFCSIVEYIASYLMEKLFKVRWWDYSNDQFNLNGRICLRNAIAFGALGVLFVCYINPFILKEISHISYNTLIIISIIIFVVTLIDIIISAKAMSEIKKTISLHIDKLSNKDATNDIRLMVNKLLLQKSYLERRFIKSYRHFIYKTSKIIDNLDSANKNKCDYSYFFVVTISILLGVFTGIITHNFKNCFVLGIIFGILLSIVLYRIKKDYDERKK